MHLSLFPLFSINHRIVLALNSISYCLLFDTRAPNLISQQFSGNNSIVKNKLFIILNV